MRILRVGLSRRELETTIYRVLTLCQVLCHVVYVNLQPPPYKVITFMVMPILQMWKLRHRELKSNLSNVIQLGK